MTALALKNILFVCIYFCLYIENQFKELSTQIIYNPSTALPLHLYSKYYSIF